MIVKPEIIYDLHDSVIVSVSTGPHHEVALVIDLYPIFYPDKPRIILRFGDIFNYEKVRKYFDRIVAEADKDEEYYIGCRIDSFQFDTQKTSRVNNCWFFIETAWCGKLRIHCSKMTMNQIENCGVEY